MSPEEEEQHSNPSHDHAAKAAGNNRGHLPLVTLQLVKIQTLIKSQSEWLIWLTLFDSYPTT